MISFTKIRGNHMDNKTSKIFKLEINNEKHTIQGVKIPDDMFLDVKASVRYNAMEGWKPTKQDINYLVERLQSDDPIIEKEMKNLWGI